MLIISRSFLATLAASWFVWASLAHATPYAFQTLDIPGSTNTRVYGINDGGAISGDYRDASDYKMKGFSMTGGDLTTIYYPDSAWTHANAINNAGEIVGEYQYNGFYWYNGAFTTINIAGANRTHLWDINDGGQIVGSFLIPYDKYHGFLKSGDTITTLDYPGSEVQETHAHGINNSLQVVGSYALWTPVRRHGFLWSAASGYQPLDFPGASQTTAHGINDACQVVGSYEDSEGKCHIFLWSEATGFVTVAHPDGYGDYEIIAYDINAAGQMVGYYQVNVTDSEHGFLANPVPLPSSVLLLGSGLLGLGALGWRRKRG
jgi:uncharacterized membrane protein